MLKVGLTGGIASGKSRVLRRLAAAVGFETLDLDAVAHQVLSASGTAQGDVVREFGPGILGPDGAIDRKALGRVVFADRPARERLNALTHPHIRDEETRRVREAAARATPVFVTDAALLVEVGTHLRYDRLVVAHCPADLQLTRLLERDGIEEAAARARLAAQMDPDLKRRFAHFVVDTSGSLDDTDAAADRLARELRAVAKGHGGRMVVPPEVARGALSWGPRQGPGGMPPARLLTEAVVDGRLEMRLLQRLVAPGARGPWYEAPSGGAAPDALAVPAVLWSLARAGADAPFTAAVVHSVSRATTQDPSAIAGACTYAIALQEAAVERRVAASDADLRVWAGIGERWGRTEPPPSVRATIAAAARAFGDPARAREGARAQGGDPDLAAALIGIATGSTAPDVPAEVESAVAALARIV